MDILIEESTTEKVPKVLERMIEILSVQQNKTPDTTQKDYLFILLIVLMIENEFVLVNDNCDVLDHWKVPSEFLDQWRSSAGVYEVNLILKEFQCTPVRLVMSPLGAMALVNVVIKEFQAETYSVCLPMSKYVVSPQAGTVPKIFRELKNFSMTFKSKVVSPVKSRILEQYGYASASLIGLPKELLFKILLNLPVNTVVNVAMTCRSLREDLQSQIFWHDMVKRDFKNALGSHSDDDWKELYKSLHKANEANKAIERMKSFNNNMNGPHFMTSEDQIWADVF